MMPSPFLSGKPGRAACAQGHPLALSSRDHLDPFPKTSSPGVTRASVYPSKDGSASGTT